MFLAWGPMKQHAENTNNSPAHKNNPIGPYQTTTEHDPNDLTEVNGPDIDNFNRESAKQSEQQEKELVEPSAAAQMQDTIKAETTAVKQTWLDQKLEAWRGIKENIQLGYDQLKKLFVEYPRAACSNTAASILSCVVTIATSSLIGYLAESTKSGGTPVSGLLSLGACLLVSAACAHLQQKNKRTISLDLYQKQRDSVVRRGSQLNYSDIQNGNTQFLYNQSYEGQYYLSSLPLQALDAALTTLSIGISGYALWAVDPLATGIVTLALLPQLVNKVSEIKKLNQFKEKSKDQYNAAQNYSNIFANLENLRPYIMRGALQELAAQTINKNGEYHAENKKYEELQFKTAGRAMMLTQVGQVGAIFYMALARNEPFGAGEIGQAIGALLVLNSTIQSFIWQGSELLKSLNTLRNVKPFLENKNSEVKQSSASKSEAAPIKETGIKLELEGVSYKMSPDANPHPRNVTLTINPGERILLVGPNGSGKTTLCHLIAGLKTPSEGSIKANDILVNTQVNNWFGCISYVGQDQKLLDGLSVKENLLAGSGVHGAPTISIAKVKEVCELNFIDNQKKQNDSIVRNYDSIVGNVFKDGTNFSGGEKERILLAAAIIKRAPVLILDEVLLHMDKESRAKFSSGLSKLFEEEKYNPTIIQVAHLSGHVFPNYREIAFNERGEVIQDTPTK